MPPAVGPVPVPRPELGGRWRKDRARSDSMDTMCEALEMGFAFRQAANLLRTVEIVQTFKLVAKAGPIGIAEVYPLSGEPVEQRRRDLRRGKAIGTACISTREGAQGGSAVTVALQWEGKMPGNLEQHFFVDEDGCLVIEQVIALENGAEALTRGVHDKIG